MAPGAKFSTKTSALRAMSLTISRPRGDFRLTVTDLLLALYIRKYGSSRCGVVAPVRRPGSPPTGFSTFTTSAPSHARTWVQEVPASNCVRSSTRTPVRQPGATALVSFIDFSNDRNSTPTKGAPKQRITGWGDWASGRDLHVPARRRDSRNERHAHADTARCSRDRGDREMGPGRQGDRAESRVS